MPPEEIGKVKYTVEADVSGVKKGLNEAKSDMQDFGNEAQASGEKASGAMSGVGDAAESVSSKLSKATGIVAAFAAAVTGVVNAYKAIAEYVRNGETLAELFTADLDTVGATEASLDKINTRIQEVGSELARKEEGGIGSLLGRSKKQIEEEYESLLRRQRSISDQVRRQRQRELKEVADQFKDQAESLSEEVSLSMLPEDRQIIAAAEKQRDALIKASVDAGIESNNAELQMALAWIDEKTKYELKKHAESLAERERREIQSADRQAKALAAAIRRELEGAADALFGTGGNSITTRMDTLVNELRQIKDDMGALR